ncbi:MAG: betaine aldehyde dehydrogenase [Holophagaceae bacterium]|nr:betaine aldehyde dehydrogenase [Holophagaceae bacterium]
MSEAQVSVAQPIVRPLIEPRRLFIGGQWLEARSGQRREVLDPSTGKVITSVADAGIEDLDAAVLAARKAFDEGDWARMSGRERARILLRVAEVMRRRTEELVATESVDVGKPVTFSRIVDVATVIETYEYYAAQAQLKEGAYREVPGGARAYICREPLGVIGAITPFNFPLILSNNKLAPALAAGNTIVHKPASDTPLSALLMAEIFAEAGIPAGVVNVITGPGARIGDAMARHPGIDKIAFTGSTDIGREVARVAGECIKPTTLELGGKSGHIIFEDADVERAVGAAIQGFIFNTGQFCMAGTRLLVARPLHDAVVGALVGALPHIPLGDPFDPATVVGPMVSAKQRATSEDYCRIALEEGATLAVGGQRIEKEGGFYFPPTVVTHVTNQSRLVQEEIFGPVLTVQAFDTEEEAIALANSTVFGLAAGLHTRDISRVHRVSARLKAGIVWVNGWAILDPSVPFGGYKQSGFGREYGPEALHYYTQVKSTVIAP